MNAVEQGVPVIRFPLPPSRASSDRIQVVIAFINYTLSSNGSTTPAYVEFPDEVQELIQNWGRT